MLAVKIAATGDQQPMISGEFRIIAIMPLFMIIAEGLDAVDAGIDRFLQQIFSQRISPSLSKAAASRSL